MLKQSIEVQGADMWLDRLKHFTHRLGMLRHPKAISPAAPAVEPLAVEFDTTWHGDHWQNLLASPLDARHYVMEDWTQPANIPAYEIAETKPIKRRRHR